MRVSDFTAAIPVPISVVQFPAVAFPLRRPFATDTKITRHAPISPTSPQILATTENPACLWLTARLVSKVRVIASAAKDYTGVFGMTRP
jgi:hypothetical protein